MQWLEVIARDHNEWINMVKSFGERNYYDDIVQDVYLRLNKSFDEARMIIDGKPNQALMYRLLKNSFLIYKKHNQDGRQTKKLPIDKRHSLSTAGEWSYDRVCNSVVANRNLGSMESKQKDQITQIDENEGYKRILSNIDKEQSKWHWFDRRIYQLYTDPNHPSSIRGLAEATKIDYWIIFHTLKKCKQRLKERLSEDWEDFSNQEYELI